MNPADLERLRLHDGDSVDVFGDTGDGITRAVRALRATAYNSGEMLRRLLPRMQRARPVVALCQRQQDARRQARPRARTQSRASDK
jgi:hypothetical protein